MMMMMIVIMMHKQEASKSTASTGLKFWQLQNEIRVSKLAQN
jgi:hypothetical protein